MTELQQKLLSILKWYHNFCQDYHLTYYIIGGTLLGAVRNKQFIPWDDDIDVAMPRNDYEKFISLTNKSTSIYNVESCYHDSADCFVPFTKIYDTTTTRIASGDIPIRKGIFVDVFPLDGISNLSFIRKIHFFAIHTLKALQSNCRCLCKKKRSLAATLAIFLARKYFSSVCLSNNYSLFLNYICKYYKFNETNYAGSLVGGAYGLKEIVPVRYYGTPKLYTFEDVLVYGPEHGDLLLTAVYGDYMTLPPLEERVSPHPPLFCDLHTSYLQK